MKRSTKVQIAHDALSHVNKILVMGLLEAVNLSGRENHIIVKSEIERIGIKTIADEMNLSIDSVMRIKKGAMIKVAAFVKSSIIAETLLQAGSNTMDKRH